MHSPCTHTPSAIRRPLAAPTWNAIPSGRREEGEDKVPGGEAAGAWMEERGERTLGGHPENERGEMGKRGLMGTNQGEGSEIVLRLEDIIVNE